MSMIPLNVLINILKKKSARLKKDIKEMNVKNSSHKIKPSKFINLSENISRDLLLLNAIEYRSTTTTVVNVENLITYNQHKSLDYARLSLALDYSKYHILITIKTFRTGGTDKLILRYLQGINEVSPNIKIVLLVVEGHKCEWDNLLPNNVSLLYLQNYMIQPFSNSLYSMILKRLIAQYEFKVLWNFNCRETYIFTEQARDFLKSVNLNIWGLVFAHWLKPNNLQEFGMVHENLQFVIDDYKVIVSDNETFTKYLHRQYDWDTTKFHTLYVPNSDDEIKFNNKVKSNSLKVLWASGIEWNKGVDTLIEISKSISDLPITLDIYGGTKNKDGENLLIGLNANIMGLKNVSYKGGFSKFSDLVQSGGYDCFLFTSIVEGMPNVVIEAAEQQLSIVTPIVGGLGEFLNSDNAYIVKNNRSAEEFVEKLKEVLLDRIEGNSFKQCNLVDSYNEKFTITKFKNNFLEVLGEDINNFVGNNIESPLDLIKIDRKANRIKMGSNDILESLVNDANIFNKILRIKPLVKKLKKDPYSFFNDSKKEYIKIFSHLFK